jgi:hypothetical protein
MASRSDRGRASSGERPTVELEAADGSGRTSVSTPTALNNLVYGSGYRPVSGTIEEAFEVLQGAQDEPGGPNPGPVTNPIAAAPSSDRS